MSKIVPIKKDNAENSVKFYTYPDGSSYVSCSTEMPDVFEKWGYEHVVIKSQDFCYMLGHLKKYEIDAIRLEILRKLVTYKQLSEKDFLDAIDNNTNMIKLLCKANKVSLEDLSSKLSIPLIALKKMSSVNYPCNISRKIYYGKYKTYRDILARHFCISGFALCSYFERFLECYDNMHNEIYPCIGIDEQGGYAMYGGKDSQGYKDAYKYILDKIKKTVWKKAY